MILTLSENLTLSLRLDHAIERIGDLGNKSYKLVQLPIFKLLE